MLYLNETRLDNDLETSRINVTAAVLRIRFDVTEFREGTARLYFTSKGIDIFHEESLF